LGSDGVDIGDIVGMMMMNITASVMPMIGISMIPLLIKANSSRGLVGAEQPARDGVV
jgi:hypothetical protein